MHFIPFHFILMSHLSDLAVEWFSEYPAVFGKKHENDWSQLQDISQQHCVQG